MLSAFILLLLTTLHADFRVPTLSGPVVDQANMLRPSTRAELERFLRALHQRGVAQVQVATVPDLGGLSIEEASIRMTDAWKLGDAKNDNGVLLLVAASERRVRIEVGQGLEGELPDIVASRIVREVILPRFKAGDLNGGVLAGVQAIVHYADPGALEGQTQLARPARSKENVGWGHLIFLLFILFLIGMGGGGRGRRRRSNPLIWGGIGYGLGRGGFGGGFGGGGRGWSGGGGGFSGGGASGGW